MKHRRFQGLFITVTILFSVFGALLSVEPLQAQGGGGTLPVVAIHVSENTQSHWTNGRWTYWTVYESLEQALKSDGTPFVEVNDSTIEAGGLLSGGEPKYPILISLAAECISDVAASQILQYVSAGGFAYVGSSAWTRFSDGTPRSDFALSSEMGVTCAQPPSNNWDNVIRIYVNGTNQLDDILPANVSIFPWVLPLDNTTSIQYNAGGDVHPFWQTVNTVTSPSDILITIPGGVYSYVLLATKAYFTGRFIYQSELTPLMGFGIYSPGLYEYYFFRRAIEWAFQSRSIALAKLSPWPYQYDSVFLVRHDCDGGTDFVLDSAQRENQLGVTGEYFVVTGMVLDDPRNASLISQLQQAQNVYGALISPHNGGLNSHYWLGTNPGDYSYYHWGPDICMLYNGTGDYPPYNSTGSSSTPTNLYGEDYANMSIKIAYDTIASWLGRRLVTWVSPWTDSCTDASLDILTSQGVKIAEERDNGPYPSQAFALNTPGKFYDILEFPSQAWVASSGSVYQRLEEHTTDTMEQMVDILYDLGAMVNMYGHVTSDGGIGEDYITYCLSKPRIWNANTLLVRDWWLQRQQVTFTPTFEQGLTGTNQVNVALAGSTSTDTAIDLVLPTNMDSVFNITVTLNGVPSTQYRTTTDGIKVRVGTATTLNVTWEGPTPESWTQTSQTDFESGTLTNLDTSSNPGSVSLAQATGGTNVLFFDDFSNAIRTNSLWTVHAGTWTVTDGLYQGTISSDYEYTYAGSTSWTDYTVEAMAKLVSGSYGAQIAARLNPSTGAHYALWLYPSAGGPNVARLVKFSSWTSWTQLGQATVTTDFNWHLLRMVLSGSSVNCFYDGSLIISALDTGYANGEIELESYGSTVQYDWVNVTSTTSTTYYTSGTLVSSAFDAGFSPQWRWITWTASTPPGTSVEFRTRTAPTQAGLTSASWSPYYTDPANSLIESPTYEWIQYEATLSTSNILVTPTLYEVTVWFSKSPYFALTVNVVGQGSVNLNNTGPYENGDVVQLTAIAQTGWSFSGWSDDLSGSANPATLVINADKLVTATFTRNTYTLTVLTVGSGSVTLNNTGPYYFGDVVQLTTNPSSGWSFQGWSGDLTGSANPATLSITDNEVTTATFTQDQYTLFVTTTGGGSVNKSPDQATYTWGTNVTLTANADVGWTFAGWSGDASGSSSSITVNMTSSESVTATFTQNQYSLTVGLAGDGVVDLDKNGPYHYGDVVQLTAIPSAGWRFDHWTGDLAGSANPATLTIDGNKVVTANFAQNEYALTVNISGQGSVSLNNTGPYHYGDTIQVTAFPAIGWSFDSWSGALSGSANPASLVMTENRTLTATFTQDVYNLVTTTGGDGSITLNNTGPYHYGDVVQLTASPTIGWSFATWSGDASGTTNPTTVTMTSNKAVTAAFTQNVYTLSINVVGQGTVNLNNSGPYHYGDHVQFTAVPAPGCSFDRWTEDLSGSTNPAVLTIVGESNVTAHFIIPTAYIDPASIQKGPSDTYSTFPTSVMVSNISDLSSLDVKLTWDDSLVSLKNVDFTTTLDDAWGHGNWQATVNASGTGYYELAAKSTATGFSCTTAKTLVTLTFIVKTAEGQTSMHLAVLSLNNSQNQSIQAQVSDGTYVITGPQYVPVLQMNPNSVSCRKYGEYFTVQVNVTNAITLNGFNFTIHYDSKLISYVGVTWGELGSGNITGVDPVNGVLEGNVAGATISGNRWLLNITFQNSASLIWKVGQANRLEGRIWFNKTVLDFSGVQELAYAEGGQNQVSVNEVGFAFVPIKGDVNNDGRVDILDLRTIAFYYDQQNSIYNLSNDNVISIFDLVVVSSNYGYAYP